MLTNFSEANFGIMYNNESGFCECFSNKLKI